MDKQTKKALRRQYEQQKPEMGIVCLRKGENRWIAISTNTAADCNSTLFQLRLGSWPNRDLQAAFSQDPNAFEWSVLKRLEYDDREVPDYSEDLSLLYELCLEEYPGARRMRAGKN